VTTSIPSWPARRRHFSFAPRYSGSVSGPFACALSSSSWPNKGRLGGKPPPDAFARDAAENGERRATWCSASASFPLRTQPGISSSNAGGGAASPTFLAPQRREDRLINAGRDSPATQTAHADPRYAPFAGLRADRDYPFTKLGGGRSAK
jgi:hypothetical protein